MALKMQDEVALDAPPAAEEKSGKKSKKLPIIIAFVLLIAIAAFIGIKIARGKHAHKSTVVKVGETVPLDEFMLNLADPSNDHYLKISISLGLKEGITAEKFKDKVPQSRDAIVMVLTAKRLADLRSTDGKIALKKELQDKINQDIGEKDVAAIYFESFATQ